MSVLAISISITEYIASICIFTRLMGDEELILMPGEQLVR